MSVLRLIRSSRRLFSSSSSSSVSSIGIDQCQIWNIGSFPYHPSETRFSKVPVMPLVETSPIFNTAAMLDALPPTDLVNNKTMRFYPNAAELIEDHIIWADSVIKKRRKKMNKHKHKKRRKAQRMKAKKA